jgi:hypothetical protein
MRDDERDEPVGRLMRVPLMTMDSEGGPMSTYDQFCAGAAQLDAQYAAIGQTALAMQRGYVASQPTADAATAVAEARAKREKRLGKAWKEGPTVPAESTASAPNPETREDEIQKRRQEQERVAATKHNRQADAAEQARIARDQRTADAWRAA